MKFTQKGTFVRTDFSNQSKIKDFMSVKRLEYLLIKHRVHWDNNMTIFYIKMKIRAGGGNFRAGGGIFRAAGCPPLLFLFMGNTSFTVW